MEPRFSIIIPSYNRATLLVNCIHTVLRQQEKCLELIIVDDGSTDNTKEVVAQFKDDRIRYFRKENEERSVARNFGMEKSKGTYINFFDSDDEMYLNHLSNALAVIEKHDHPPVFHVGYEIVDANGKVLKQVKEQPTNFRKKLAYENFLSCNSVFLRKDIAKEFRFNEDKRLLTSEDYELWLRIASKYQFVSDPTITYRMNEHQGRSLNAIEAQKVKEKYMTMITCLLKENDFAMNFKKYVAFFKSSKYSYLGLIYSETKEGKIEAINLLLKAVLFYPLVLADRRIWASLRNLVVV